MLPSPPDNEQNNLVAQSIIAEHFHLFKIVTPINLSLTLVPILTNLLSPLSVRVSMKGSGHGLLWMAATTP